VENILKNHQGTKTCKEAKAKREQEAKQKKDGSLLTFLKPCPKPVPRCNIRSSRTGGSWWIERKTLSSNRESKFSRSAKITSQINFRVSTAATCIENPTKHYSRSNSKRQACPFCKCHGMRWSRPGIRWPLGRGFEPVLERSIRLGDEHRSQNPSSIILFAFALSRYLKIGFAMLVQLWEGDGRLRGDDIIFHHNFLTWMCAWLRWLVGSAARPLAKNSTLGPFY